MQTMLIVLDGGEVSNLAAIFSGFANNHNKPASSRAKTLWTNDSSKIVKNMKKLKLGAKYSYNVLNTAQAVVTQSRLLFTNAAYLDGTLPQISLQLEPSPRFLIHYSEIQNNIIFEFVNHMVSHCIIIKQYLTYWSYNLHSHGKICSSSETELILDFLVYIGFVVPILKNSINFNFKSADNNTTHNMQVP